MASPIVTNTSAQLNGASLVYGFQTALNDAQIKALPTTPVSVVAAPGAGFRIKVIAATLYLDSGNGAYTNINTAYAACVLAYTNATSFWAMGGPVNDSSLATPIANLSTMFGSAAQTVCDMAPVVTAYDGGATSGAQDWVIPNGILPAYANVHNVGIFLSMDNNGSGVLTGGNALNTGKVTVYYAVEAIS